MSHDKEAKSGGWAQKEEGRFIRKLLHCILGHEWAKLIREPSLH